MENSINFIADDSGIIGSKKEVSANLLYSFKASIEDAEDFDYLKEIASDFADIMDEINSTEEAYIAVVFRVMDGSPEITLKSDDFDELKERWESN